MAFFLCHISLILLHIFSVHFVWNDCPLCDESDSIRGQSEPTAHGGSVNYNRSQLKTVHKQIHWFTITISYFLVSGEIIEFEPPQVIQYWLNNQTDLRMTFLS